MEFFLRGFDDEVRRHWQLKEHARRNVAVVAVDEYSIDASNVLVAAAVTTQGVHSHGNVQPLYICFHESFGICLAPRHTHSFPVGRAALLLLGEGLKNCGSATVQDALEFAHSFKVGLKFAHCGGL